MENKIKQITDKIKYYELHSKNVFADIFQPNIIDEDDCDNYIDDDFFKWLNENYSELYNDYQNNNKFGFGFNSIASYCIFRKKQDTELEYKEYSEFILTNNYENKIDELITEVNTMINNKEIKRIINKINDFESQYGESFADCFQPGSVTGKYDYIDRDFFDWLQNVHPDLYDKYQNSNQNSLTFKNTIISYCEFRGEDNAELMYLEYAEFIFNHNLEHKIDELNNDYEMEDEDDEDVIENQTQIKPQTMPIPEIKGYVIIDKTDDKPKLRYGVFTQETFQDMQNLIALLNHNADGWNEYDYRETKIHLNSK